VQGWGAIPLNGIAPQPIFKIKPDTLGFGAVGYSSVEFRELGYRSGRATPVKQELLAIFCLIFYLKI